MVVDGDVPSLTTRIVIVYVSRYTLALDVTSYSGLYNGVYHLLKSLLH